MLHVLAKTYHKLPHEFLQSKLTPLEALSIDSHILDVGLKEESRVIEEHKRRNQR